MSSRTIRSIRGAVAFVDRVGLALLFPSDDLVLPSLWEAVAGTPEITWSQRDAEGRFLDFSPEFGRVWRWKDELPERRLVCVGKHVGGRSALVSLELLPALVASARPPELGGLEHELAETLDEQGPLTVAELARLAGRERRKVAPAVDWLQRRLIATAAGSRERNRGWPAVVIDLIDRRYRDRLQDLPRRDEAQALLAAAVLRAAKEVSAADLAAILGCRRAEAAAALDGIAEDGRARRRDEEGFAIWTAIRSA